MTRGFPIFPVVTHTAQSNARTGIQAVTRGICHGLSSLTSITPMAFHSRRGYLHGLKPEWSRNLRIEPSEIEMSHSLMNPRNWLVSLLSGGRHSHAPLHLHPDFRDRLRGAWLLLPELMVEDPMRHLIKYAHRHNLKIAAIYHDAIPLLRPDLTERTPQTHEAYMRALVETDLVLPVSEVSADHFKTYLNNWNVPLPRIRVCPLPAEVLGEPRVRVPKPFHGGPINILCVSTLEPRKNHRLLIDSFLGVQRRNPGLSLNLHLAGDRFTAAPEVEKFVSAMASAHSSIIWHRNPDFEQLRDLYRLCDFTVYPSYLEGFGMPVMESLWLARPCVCANTGVMQKNADGGGCLTVDVLSESELANALELLCMEKDLYTKLAQEAVRRELRTWSEYARSILDLMAEASDATHRSAL